VKVACLTIIYPAMAGFLHEYLQCIQDQTFKDFDLIIINDQFPSEIETPLKKIGIPFYIFPFSNSPQKNRLFGMKTSYEMGYDIVICSDSDETMYPDRIEKNIAYFSRNREKKIVYNNSVGQEDGHYFDLYYKDIIELEDNIDFNVLGYGALNLRRELIPFVLQHANEKVMAFDWWLGLVYLLNSGSVEVLKDARNNYRSHPGNFIGPVFEIQKDNIKKGINVKKILYAEMINYCQKNDFKREVDLFRWKLNEVIEIEGFIKKYSIEYYTELVKQYFKDAKRIYWWQDVVPIRKVRT